MSDENFDLQQERDRLSAEVARLCVERDTGVPASLLSTATTEDEARSLAGQALAWRGSAAPAAPPAPPPAYLPNQLPRSALSQMTPDQINAARQRGQLAGIGAPPEPPRRTGERGSRHL